MEKIGRIKKTFLKETVFFRCLFCKKRSYRYDRFGHKRKKFCSVACRRGFRSKNATGEAAASKRMREKYRRLGKCCQCGKKSRLGKSLCLKCAKKGSLCTMVSHRLKVYGISHAKFTAMSRSQKGRCALCDEIGKYALHVDHDHRKKQTRALLCFTCNSGLGHFRDSPQLLRRAAAYLEKNWADQEEIQ